MSYWTPMQQKWLGEDAYIIGGGPSLDGFDFNLLKGRRTIGCNAAFRLGVEICNVCLFSDLDWYNTFKAELERFPGMVVTQNPKLMRANCERLHVMRREQWGLHSNALGLNGNSGPSAVNLALILGSVRVFLLGFDCKKNQGRTHWHDWAIQEVPDAVYRKFLKGWGCVQLDLPKVFPGASIINLGPDSAIPYFPKEDYRQHFGLEVAA